MIVRSTLLAAAFILGAIPALACDVQIEVSFTETAPKDIFNIENKSVDARVRDITLDLTTSRGNMIFDTEVGGTGLNVAQPFERRSGSASIAAAPEIIDGDAVLTVMFSDFSAGQNFQFTIDVDDQLTQSDRGQTMISGSEMQGTTITSTVRTSDGQILSLEGVFDNRNKATLTSLTCA